MDLSLGDRWEALVKEAVRSGRFASAEAVVHEGLRLVEEQESRLAALRAGIEEAIDDPRPPLPDDAVGEMLRQRALSYRR